MKNFKKFIIFIKDLFKARQNLTHTGEESSYQMMRFLFLISDGLFIKFIAKFFKKKNDPKYFKNSYELLPQINKVKINEIKNEILKMKVSHVKGKNKSIVFDNKNNIDFDYYKNQKIVRLNISSKELLSNDKIVNFLIQDIDISNKLKNITGSDLYLIGLNSWITLPVPSINESYEKTAVYEASQMWHRDVDNLRDIKYMIYLTDVEDENSGPFEIVKNTHIFNWFSPFNYFDKKTFRAKDKLIKKKYQNKIFSFLGNQGTNFLVDTRAFHRGKIIKKKQYRIVLQLYFSIHFFGRSKKINFDQNLKNHALLKNNNFYSSIFNDRSS